MEVVRVFNNELSSLYEVKPPISKAKMTQITKSAIKGIKFYKHIVQSVEKFIQKCRPEYKVPGLYVVDSIVRQSRHQFGADKDVFGPRFVKNITMTFQHLFKCAEDDRPKIIRVLNLWQKNAVFPIDVIQPLLDMGHPNTSGEWPANENAEAVKESPAKKSKDESRHKSSDWKGWPQNNEEQVQDNNKTYAEMSTKNLEKFNKAEMMNIAKDDEATYKNQVKLEKGPEETVKFNKKLLDFDYGDEEDEEEAKNEDNKIAPDSNALALSMAQNFLSNPELLRQLHQMAASTMQQNDVLKDMNMQALPPQADDSQASYPQDMQSSPQLSLIPPQYQQLNTHLAKSETDTDDRVLPEPPLPSRDLDERSLASVMASHDRLLPTMCLPVFQQTGLTPQPPLPDKDDRIIPEPMPPRDLDERSLASIIAPPDRAVMPPIPYSENSTLMQFQYDKNGIPFQPPPAMPMMEPNLMEAAYSTVMAPDPHLMQNSQGDEDERVMYSMPGEPPLPPQDFDERQIMMPVEDRSRKERSRSRSGSRSRGRGSRRRSRSRSPRRKRSRSRSHTRKGRSRSRDRGERIREKERERERERERRKKGLPPIKKGCVSVCSITLWLGHVPKSCSEVDIKNTFNQFGNILSIDMIPPRGCAYVVMERRQDGYKALQKLKNLKLQGSSIKMAWAPGKGVKGKEYKEFWDVDLGVSYVPYEKIKEDAEMLALLEEGGYIDEDSLPDQLKALRKQPDDEKHPYNAINKSAVEANASFSDIQTAPNMVPPPVMPPTSMNIPMVLPHLMQPQFGLHLPGMLPPQAMVMQVPMGIPPPAPMLMVQQQSQGLLGNQPLSMVGGVPQIVPRPIPPATAGLSNIKTPTQSDSVLPAASTGDATPTEEDGTGVSSPSVQKSASGTASVPSTQPVVSAAQFNQILSMTANRPLLAVPPPVSTAGTPIPYPPPNMSFNFPPPGIRPPGQAHSMPPNPQFPWMQKQVGSPFTDADSSQTTTPSARPVPPPQSGMSLHMFGNRPPFHDSHSSVSNVNSSPMKEPHKGRESLEHKPGDIDGNRNVSPSHHDKMSQEMVISTDDESSMDIEYSRGEMPPGPCFPNAPDFQRSPMNMQRMRGPPGPMPPGPRFRGMPMGSPFPMRMGGPRGMGGPGMHNRMDMEFSPHGGRGPRMPMGPHGPRRNDGMHPPHDPRDWYPRDFEGPPFERERDRRYRDDWGREPWEMEGDLRHNSSRDREDRRDDHRDSWNRDRSNNANNARPFRDNNEKNDSSGRQRDKPPPNKGNIHKSLMNDLLKLRRGNSSDYSKTNRNDLPKDKPIQKDESNKEESNDGIKNNDPVVEQSNSVKEPVNELPPATKRERDREYRKRSRWGRTLSEEREFQQKKRSEIEMKFQSYEQSHAAQQPLQNSADNPVQSSEETSKDEPVPGSMPDMSALSSDVPITNPVQSVVDAPPSTDIEMPAQKQETALQNSEMPTFQNNSEIPSFENSSEIPLFENSSEIPSFKNNSETPSFQNSSEIPPFQNSHVTPSLQNSCETPVQNFIPELNTEMESKIPSESNTVLSVPEVVNSCNTSDKVTFEADVIENASCTENVSDINANSDSSVIASTSNENSVLPDDVITNSSSLVPSES